MTVQPISATCTGCGASFDVQPPNLPPSGGSLKAHDDPVHGWLVDEYVCGGCWARRPRTWTCVHCGGTGPIGGNFCSRCHHVRPDPLPYVPDWDLIWKEERMRREEAQAIAAEWDRVYPGWRTQTVRKNERV